MDRLEHFGYDLDLISVHNGENIAAEMHRVSPIFDVWEHLAHCLQHPHVLIAGDGLHAVQSSATESLEKVGPASLVSFHPLGGTQALAETVFTLYVTH